MKKYISTEKVDVPLNTYKGEVYGRSVVFFHENNRIKFKLKESLGFDADCTINVLEDTIEVTPMIDDVELIIINKDSENVFVYIDDEDIRTVNEYLKNDDDDDELIFDSKEEELNGIILYSAKGNEDMFCFKFNDKYFLFNCYQIENLHKRKNDIVISGWDTTYYIDTITGEISNERTR